ncbi:radial spoke head protein 9 [Trichonephila inaurata madagascariensis]|uniref:Radial spoke head protein 9 homolog n=1 Tax=Trichonephila inaurata madagascariensis TaxID=2747483 RepID=A0A8X6WPI8_9ARAC|nr:radial spoke head protein 9 [Trichonephila inaurata madagascariensis]
MPVSDALKLESYLHYRLPDSDVSFAPTTLVCPPGGDRALQFLEPISKDYPPGELFKNNHCLDNIQKALNPLRSCWTLQSDSLQEVVTIQNLWWPGFRSYHIPETGEFNSIYVGYGERNDDLPFMI